MEPDPLRPQLKTSRLKPRLLLLAPPILALLLGALIGFLLRPHSPVALADPQRSPHRLLSSVTGPVDAFTALRRRLTATKAASSHARRP